VHLVGFIIRIYHDARSPERQKIRRYVDFTIAMLSRLIGAVRTAQAFDARKCQDYPPTALLFVTVLNRKLYIMV